MGEIPEESTPSRSPRQRVQPCDVCLEKQWGGSRVPESCGAEAGLGTKRSNHLQGPCTVRQAGVVSPGSVLRSRTAAAEAAPSSPASACASRERSPSSMIPAPGPSMAMESDDLVAEAAIVGDGRPDRRAQGPPGAGTRPATFRRRGLAGRAVPRIPDSGSKAVSGSEDRVSQAGLALQLRPALLDDLAPSLECPASRTGKGLQLGQPGG